MKGWSPIDRKTGLAMKQKITLSKLCRNYKEHKGCSRSEEKVHIVT